MSGVYQNQFNAVVHDLIYSGDHVRCLLEIFGRRDWSAKITDRSIAAGIARGATVTVGWDAKDCLLFGRDAPAPSVGAHAK